MEIKSNSNYSNSVFTSNVQIGDTFESIEFLDCVFSFCDLSESKFRNCIFEKCKFQSTNLSNCKFDSCKLIETVLEKSKLIGIDWTSFSSKVGLRLNCTNCDLSYGVFIGMDISESSFISCKLHEMDLSEAVSKNVLYNKSDLLKSVFYKTNLKESDFTNAYNYVFDPSINYCKGAKFSKSDVTNLLIPYGIEIVEDDSTF